MQQRGKNHKGWIILWCNPSTINMQHLESRHFHTSIFNSSLHGYLWLWVERDLFFFYRYGRMFKSEQVEHGKWLRRICYKHVRVLQHLHHSVFGAPHEGKEAYSLWCEANSPNKNTVRVLNHHRQPTDVVLLFAPKQKKSKLNQSHKSHNDDYF